jgi:hypothetical protein
MFDGADKHTGQTAVAEPFADGAGNCDDGRPDPYLKSMLLRLIEESYLSAGTFTDFAAEVLEVLVYAVTVPVAFTEGFLRAYLSVDRVVESEDGCLTIIPRAGASLADVISDADAILARVDAEAVYNPIVRSSLSSAHQVSRTSMEWEIDDLATMDDDQLMDVLRAMQAASERERLAAARQGAEATDHIRARIATIRRNMQQYVDRHEAEQGFLL